MIRGVVNARLDAVIRSRVRGPGGSELEADAIVDSGSNGWLILPMATTSALGLNVSTEGKVILADGVSRPFDLYSAEIDWDGRWRPVVVPALGHTAMIGMKLLAGHELRVEVVPGGPVSIVPLS